MVRLITLQGPSSGQQFLLDKDCCVIGRQPDSEVYLESLAVSRQHAQITCHDGTFYVEDLDSSNGTYLNGRAIVPRVPQGLTDRDTVQIGPYVLALRRDPEQAPTGPHPQIRAEISALASNQTLYAQNPAHKLQVVLEIAQHLARTLDVGPLLNKLLEHLLILFPQADRALVILCQGDRLVPRAQCGRGVADPHDFRYSRTMVRRALDGGVGILSEDVREEHGLDKTPTLLALNIRSLLCVPLICSDGRRLGVIQLDCARPGHMFRPADVELLTAVGLQVAVVLDNAALHAERLHTIRLEEEVRLAREIQGGFLPTNYRPLGNAGFELYATVHPARQVSGDLYDFFPLEGRLAFFVGDVSGKGMPASLFMVAVRTLSRHLASAENRPGETLRRLSAALSADNSSGTFVTLLHGLYDPRTGEVIMASGGHPLPLLRRADGRVETVAMRTGLLLGCDLGRASWPDTQLTLAPGETLIVYTDGFSEARAPDGTMFGEERLCELLGGSRASLPLEVCAEEARGAIERFTGSSEQQDDLTLFLLRRTAT